MFNLKKTDGTKIATVQDFTIDTSTSLQIPGRGASNFAGIIGDDFVSLLENFSNNTSPSNPIEGQIWYRTENPSTGVVDGSLYVYQNGSWNSASKAIVSETIPDIASYGTLWLMKPENMLWIYDSSVTSPVPEFTRDSGVLLTGSWRLIGPNYSSNSGTIVYQKTVIDTNSQKHLVIVTEVGGVTNTIQSKDEFNLDTTIEDNLNDFVSLNMNGIQQSDYAPIYPGINLNNSINSNQSYFNGVSIKSINSLNLVDFDKTDVIGRGGNKTLIPTYPKTDAATDLGSSTNKWNNFYSVNVIASNSMTVSGSQVLTLNSINNQDINISNIAEFTNSGKVILYKQTSKTTDEIFDIASNVGGVKNTVMKVTADGSVNVIGGGHLYDTNNRVIVTNPLLSTEIDALNIVSDPTNNHIRVRDVNNTVWDLRDASWTSNNFISSQNVALTDYKSGSSLVYDNSTSSPCFEYNNSTEQVHLASTNWVSGNYLSLGGGTITGTLAVLGTLETNNIVVSQGYSLSTNNINSSTTGTVIISNTATFNTAGHLSLKSTSNTASTAVLDVYSNYGTSNYNVARIAADGSTSIYGGGRFVENGHHLVGTWVSTSTDREITQLVGTQAGSTIWLRDTDGKIYTIPTVTGIGEYINYTETSGELGSPLSYTIFRTVDSSTPSGYRYKLSAQSQQITQEGDFTVNFPFTFSGIFPGAYGVSELFINAGQYQSHDTTVSIIGIPNLSSMVINCNQSGNPWTDYPICALYWIEGW